jgi:hypothetical protein
MTAGTTQRPPPRLGCQRTPALAARAKARGYPGRARRDQCGATRAAAPARRPVFLLPIDAGRLACGGRSPQKNSRGLPGRYRGAEELGHLPGPDRAVGCGLRGAAKGAVRTTRHRLVDLSLCHLEQTALLWKELPQQPIGVFVEPALPRAVRARKVHLRLQTTGNEFVLGELLAVVKG